MTGSMKAFFSAFILLCGLAANASQRETIYPAMYRWGAELVTPDKKPTTKMPLVVLLHGCKIDGSDILSISEIEKYVDANKFAVITPNQSRNLNADNCWNFFLPLNQRPYRAALLTSYEETYSDVAYISRTVAAAIKADDIDTNRIYIAGLSSGAAMALNVLLCDTDHRYAGVAINSGLSFAVAQDAFEASRIISEGSNLNERALRHLLTKCPRRINKVKFSVIHGDADTRIIPENYKELLVQLGQPRNTTAGRFQTQLVPGLAHKWSGSKFDSPYGDSKTIPFTPMFLKHFGLIK